MRKYLLLTALCLAAAQAWATGNSRIERIIKEIHNPSSEQVLVASHRGDWRNNPENSLQAIEDAINAGADIVEIDLALTSDSVLVLCHDRTLDRTTTGHGLVADYPLEQIRTLRLRAGHSEPTPVGMPTLEEALLLCKDRIVVNIDKGYQYYDLVQRLAEKLGVTGQLLIKGGVPRAEVQKKFASYPANMMWMPIIHPTEPKGETLLEEYFAEGTTPPLAVEICWNTPDNPAVWQAMTRIKEAGSKVWANTLWDSLCGGLSDDNAYYSGNPEEVYGELFKKGVTMIQTDRPAFLVEYLRSKGLHP